MHEEVIMNFIQSVFAADLEIPRNTNIIKISNIGQLVSALVGTLLILATLMAFLYLIIGGISWITSGGDKAGMETARNKITHAIVGLIIVGAAWAIMTLVQNFLGITIIGGSIDLPKPY